MNEEREICINIFSKEEFDAMNWKTKRFKPVPIELVDAGDGQKFGYVFVRVEEVMDKIKNAIDETEKENLINLLLENDIVF